MKPNQKLGCFELDPEDIRALGPPTISSTVLFSGAELLIQRAHDRLQQNATRSDVTDYIGSAREEAIIDKARVSETLRMIIDCAARNMPAPVISRDDIDRFWQEESK